MDIAIFLYSCTVGISVFTVCLMLGTSFARKHAVRAMHRRAMQRFLEYEEQTQATIRAAGIVDVR